MLAPEGRGGEVAPCSLVLQPPSPSCWACKVCSDHQYPVAHSVRKGKEGRKMKLTLFDIFDPQRCRSYASCTLCPGT